MRVETETTVGGGRSSKSVYRSMWVRAGNKWRCFLATCVKCLSNIMYLESIPYSPQQITTCLSDKFNKSCYTMPSPGRGSLLHIQ